MKIKIISDGTLENTVILSDTGEKIDNWEYICWEIDKVSGIVNVNVHLTEVGVVLKGDTTK